MTPTAPPVCRCSQCGGWMTGRALQAEEPTIRAIHCLACGWDMECIGGQWEAISRPAGAAAPWPKLRLPVATGEGGT